MDFLTITLIVVGTVAVAAFIVLAYLEVSRKNSGRDASDASDQDSSVESVGPVVVQPPASMVAERESDRERKPEPEPEPESEADAGDVSEKSPSSTALEDTGTSAAQERPRFSWETPAETEPEENAATAEPVEEASPSVSEPEPTRSFTGSGETSVEAEPAETTAETPAKEEELPAIDRLAASASSTAASEPVEEKTSAEPEPVIEEPAPDVAESGAAGAILGDLNDAQRKAITWLSIMPAGFDRDAAIAVAGCTGEDVDVLVKAGLLDFDPDHGELVWNDTIRRNLERTLSSADSHAARLRHSEYFTDRGLKAQVDLADTKGGSPVSLELFGVRLAHFSAAFDFLKSTEGLDAQLLKLLDAVGYTTVLEMDGKTRVEWLTIGLDRARKLKDRVLERDLLGHLAGAYSEIREDEQAIELHQQAAAISRELGDKHEEGRNLGNMGRAWHRMGNLDKAAEYYELVLGIMRESGDRVREGLALTSLGQVAADRGEYEKAIDYFEQHLQVAQETRDHRSAMMAMSGIGDCYMAEGDLEAAQSFYDRQLQNAQQVRDLQAEGNALGKLGKIHLERGNPDQAVVCYDRQVEVAHLVGDARSGVRAMGNLGLAHLEADRTSRALECFDEQLKIAREIHDRDGEAHALLNSARAVHSRGQVVDAITRASAALPVFQEIGSPEVDEVRAEIEKWRAERY